MSEYFKITRRYDGKYIISIGTGKTSTASDLQEVVYALEHYWQDSVPGFSKTPFNYHKHIEHNKECGCCPLCRGE